jgi:hypothetical protein
MAILDSQRVKSAKTAAHRPQWVAAGKKIGWEGPLCVDAVRHASIPDNASPTFSRESRVSCRQRLSGSCLTSPAPPSDLAITPTPLWRFHSWACRTLSCLAQPLSKASRFEGFSSRLMLAERFRAPRGGSPSAAATAATWCGPRAASEAKLPYHLESSNRHTPITRKALWCARVDAASNAPSPGSDAVEGCRRMGRPLVRRAHPGASCCAAA